MAKIIPFLFTLLISLSLGTGYTLANQQSLTPLDRVDIRDGLSNNVLTSILKDSRGYTWVGTIDGLNSISNLSITTFENDVYDKILPSNHITSLAEDSRGRIWIGTNSGLAVYDFQMDHITHVEKPEIAGQSANPNIRCIIFNSDTEQIICVNKLGGPTIYDLELNIVKQCPYGPKTTQMWAELLDDKHLLMINYRWATIYNLESGESEKIFLKDPDDKRKNLALYSLDLYENSALIGSSKGIYRLYFKYNDGRCQLSNSECVLTSSKSITAIEVDNDNGVWFCSQQNELSYMHSIESAQSALMLANMGEISRLKTLSNNKVAVGTRDSGLFIYPTKPNLFSALNTPNLKYRQILRLDPDNILIKAVNGKVFRYNISSNRYRELKCDFDISNTSYTIVDSAGVIWSYAADGLFRLSLANNTLSSQRVENEHIQMLKRMIPTTVVEDMYGDLWVGYTNNLFRISLDKDRNITNIESIHSNKYFEKSRIKPVNVIYPDIATNSIWIGTNIQGLYQIKQKESNVHSLQDLEISRFSHSDQIGSLSSNSVSAINRSPKGELWIGTIHGGLNKFNEQESTFTTISERNGLSSNVIIGICSDKASNLWIATNKALSYYDTTREYFKEYNSSNGLALQPLSGINSIGETIFLAGSNSIVAFKPKEIEYTNEIPIFHLNKFRIYNDIIYPKQIYGGREILSHRVSNGDTIRLNHDENIFSFNLDMIQSAGTIHYQLYPVNESWITASASQPTISFNNLSPGDYTLKVQVSNSSGDKTPIQSIYIVISPPIWRSNLAYAIYILLFIAALSYAAYIFVHIQNIKVRLQMEESKKESLEMLNREKQRYFANITHELKTPLTLIMAPLAQLINHFEIDVKVTDKLNILKRQANKMLQLIDLAHSMQLGDDNFLEQKPSLFLFDEFINETTTDFSFMAKYYNKCFEITHPEHSIRVMADRDLLEKLLNNLLNNAFKYTKSSDEIGIKYLCNKQILTITIYDRGAGIVAEDLPHIFERYYMAKSGSGAQVGGTGLGLAFSKQIVELHSGSIVVKSGLGEGTTFTINLPIVVEQLESNVDGIQNEELSTEQKRAEMILGSMEQLNSDDFKSQYSNSMVYIVDDNYEMCSFLNEIVGVHYQTKTFSNGAECIESCLVEWPDIILSDVMMEPMRGDDMCRAIKSDIKMSHIPIILITACNTIDDRISALNDGADAYIEKPFYPKHVLTRIETLLNGRNQLKERYQAGIPLTQGKEGGIPAKDNEFLEKLYKLFDENLQNEDIDLAEVATALCMNRTSFFNKVKSLLGDSPYELLKNYRLKHAAELLLTREYSVKQVCMMTGFKSRPHFSRLFKERFNVSASDYVDSVTDIK